MSDDKPCEPFDALAELLLTCCYEREYPVSLAAWCRRIADLDGDEAKKLAVDMQEQTTKMLVAGLDGVHTWLTEIRGLCPATEEDENTVNPTRLYRSSPSAVFLRKTRLAFAKMSFDEAIDWWADVEKWCRGTLEPRDERSTILHLSDLYRQGVRSGDYQTQVEASSLFDLHEPSTPNRTDLALLHVANREYGAGNIKAAQDALTEAVRVARRLGHSESLAACASLAKRLDMDLALKGDVSDSIASLSIGDSRATPNETLWEIKRSMALGTASPSALTALLYSSRTMCQNRSTPSPDTTRQSRWSYAGWESSWHACAALLWDELDCAALAEVQEEIAEEVMDPYERAWSSCLPLYARKASRLCEAFAFDEALDLLLCAVDTPAKRSGMGIAELVSWKRAVYDVLLEQARARNIESIADHITATAPEPAPYMSVERADSAKSLYAKGRHFLRLAQPIQALPYLLKAIRDARVRGQESLRLRLVCLIIDARLAISFTKEEAQRSLDEIDAEWTAFLRASLVKPELLATAKICKARILITVCGLDNDAGFDAAVGKKVKLAVELLQEATKVFGELRAVQQYTDGLVLMACLFDRLSRLELGESAHWKGLRDEAACNLAAARNAATRQDAETREWALLREVEAVMANIESLVERDCAVVVGGK